MRRIRFSYRLKHGREKRKVKNLLALLLVFISVCVICGRLIEAKPAYTVEAYTVGPGDTFWTLAERYSCADPRRWIEEVRQLNNNHSSWLYTGETIKILKEN